MTWNQAGCINTSTTFFMYAQKSEKVTSCWMCTDLNFRVGKTLTFRLHSARNSMQNCIHCKIDYVYTNNYMRLMLKDINMYVYICFSMLPFPCLIRRRRIAFAARSESHPPSTSPRYRKSFTFLTRAIRVSELRVRGIFNTQ